MLEGMRIIGDFVLCKDVTKEVNGSTTLLTLGTPEDDRMSSDNLHIFEVVKLPEHKINTDRYLDLNIGDRVISISTGNDFKIDGIDYKMFELQYITAKING